MMMKKRTYHTPQVQAELIYEADLLTLSVGSGNELDADFGDFNFE